jgi:hypothetical protein
MLLSEGRRVEVVPLPHCFVLLPKNLLKLYDLLPVFRATRDEATPPCALHRRRNVLSSHLPGVDYAIYHGIPATCIT